MDEQQKENNEINDLSVDESTEKFTNPMKRSRLRSSLEKQTKHQIAFMILAMIAIVGLLGYFAVPILVNYGVLLEKIQGNEEVQTEEQSTSFIAPPVLMQEFTATNSAEIAIEGTTTSMHTIKLYVNDELEDKVTAKKDGSFIIRNVKLTDGENVIKAKAVDQQNKESNFSRAITVSYKHKEPELTIDYPSDNQIITTEDNKVILKGKTDPEVKVTVNGFWAIVDGSGNWQYTLNLQGGDNRYKVVATDQAGNKKELERNVIYNR